MTDSRQPTRRVCDGLRRALRASREVAESQKSPMSFLGSFLRTVIFGILYRMAPAYYRSREPTLKSPVLNIHMPQNISSSPGNVVYVEKLRGFKVFFFSLAVTHGRMNKHPEETTALNTAHAGEKHTAVAVDSLKILK